MRHGYTEELKKLNIDVVKTAGESHVLARCPFHKEGKEQHPSFWFNVRTGQWKCFTCDIKGGFNRLVFLVTGKYPIDSKKKREIEGQDMLRLLRNSVKEYVPDITEEKILEYRKTLHRSIAERIGNSKEVADHFELGYSKEDGTIIPVRDEENKLVGHIIREIKEGGRYISYCKKSNYLFHLNHARKYDILLLTEGPFDTINAFRCGYPNCVSLMGRTLSSQQEKLLLRYANVIVLALDQDEPGKEAKDKIGERLSKFRRVINFPFPPNKKDLGELSKEEFDEAMKKLNLAQRMPSGDKNAEKGEKQ